MTGVHDPAGALARVLAGAVLCAVLSACSGGGDSGTALPFTRSPLDSGSKTIWSVDLHIADDPDVALLKDVRNRLHADMIRIYYEPDVGNAFYDTLLANATAIGLQIDFITPYPVAPFDPTAYAQIAGTAAARYSGKHLFWEIINEPDVYVSAMSLSRCIAVETAAAKAIRSADSSATILTGGTSGRDSNEGFPYARTLGQALAPYVTGIGIHPYGVAPSAFPSEAAQISYSTGKPAYLTEWSTTSASDLLEAMIASNGYTPMFDAYEYQNEPGDPDYGLIDNGLWQTFAQEASQ